MVTGSPVSACVRSVGLLAKVTSAPMWSWKISSASFWPIMRLLSWLPTQPTTGMSAALRRRRPLANTSISVGVGRGRSKTSPAMTTRSTGSLIMRPTARCQQTSASFSRLLTPPWSSWPRL